MAESPANQSLDFTHRDYRPDHKPNPTKPGIPVSFFGMTPQKAGALLNKVAVKSKLSSKGRAGKVKAGKTTIIAHGRKS